MKDWKCLPSISKERDLSRLISNKNQSQYTLIQKEAKCLEVQIARSQSKKL
jgi:type IV secretory pathway component VirB8